MDKTQPKTAAELVAEREAREERRLKEGEELRKRQEKEDKQPGSVYFFGEVDLNPKTGKPAGPMPAHYHSPHIDAMDEEIRRKTAALAKGMIPESEIPYAKAALEKERTRRALIRKPKLDAVQKDRVAKVYKSLGEKISESMFSQDEIDRGLPRPNEELRRQKEPIIELKEEGEARMLMDNHIRVTRDGQAIKASRDDLVRIWKLCGASLDESTNVERLRRK